MNRGITFTFYSNTGPLLAGLKAADAGLAGTARHASTLGTRMYAAGSKMQAVGFAAQKLTLPLAIAGGASIKMAIDFEESLSKMERLAGVSHETVVKWQRKILELGPKVAQSPKDLADALYFLASSGVPTAKAMDVLTISAKASSAGLGNVQVVADGLSSVLNVYGYANITAAEAADILTEAVKLGKGEADEYARVVGRITPVANQLKIPFRDVAAALAAVTNQGLSTSEAATGIRQAMIALEKPTKAGAKILAEAGTSMEEIRQIAVEKGLLPALRRMREITGGNVEVFGKLFPNVRGLNAALMLTSQEGAASVDGIFKEMGSSTGELDNAFKKASNTTKFKMNKALANLKTAGIELGESFLPLVKDLSDKLSELSDWFSDLDENQRKWVGYAMISAMLLGPLVRTLGNLAKVFSVLANHPVLAAFVVLIAIGIYLYKNWEPFHDLIEKIKDILTGDGMKEGIDAFSKGVDENTRITKKNYDQLGWFQRRMYDFGVGVDTFKGNWQGFTEAMSDGAFQRGLSEIGSAFKAGLDQIYAWLDSWGIIDFFMGTFESIRVIITSTFEVVVGVVKFFAALFTLNWEALWNSVKDIASAFWGWIVGTFWGVVQILQGALTSLGNFFRIIWTAIWNVVVWFVGLIRGAFGGVWDGLVGGLQAAWVGIQWIWSVIWSWITGIGGAIAGATTGMWDGFSNAFKGAINWIIDKWNGLSLSLPKVSTPFGDIGGWTLDTPNVPRLAKGAVVDSATLAIIGEAGREVVFPTNDPERGFNLLRQAGVELPAGQAGSVKQTAVKITNHITALDPSVAARKWSRQTMWDLKSNGVAA